MTFNAKRYYHKLIIIGCGGNGSRLLSHLSQYVSSQNLSSRFSIVLIDEDVVEPSNLSRQDFHQRDIGQPKAKVLAQRYSYKGLSVDWHNSFVSSAKGVQTILNPHLINLVFLCVDNNPTRQLFWSTMKGEVDVPESASQNNWVLFDCGNEVTHGQCVATANIEKTLVGQDPRVLFPDMQRPSSAAALPQPGGSCDAHVVSRPQTLYANEQTSLFAYQNFFQYMEHGQIFPLMEWAFQHPIGDVLATGMEVEPPVVVGKEGK